MLINCFNHLIKCSYIIFNLLGNENPWSWNTLRVGYTLHLLKLLTIRFYDVRWLKTNHLHNQRIVCLYLFFILSSPSHFVSLACVINTQAAISRCLGTSVLVEWVKYMTIYTHRTQPGGMVDNLNISARKSSSTSANKPSHTRSPQSNHLYDTFRCQIQVNTRLYIKQRRVDNTFDC